MKEGTVGYHLSEAIRCTEAAGFYARCISGSEKKGTFSHLSHLTYERLMTQREGEALGHAFRAAELAYDLGARATVRAPRLRRMIDPFGIPRIIIE